MPVTRTALNVDLAALVEPHTGPILKSARSAHGFSSDYTGTIHGSTGRVFVKAVRDPGPYTGSLEREAAINPTVRDLSPALLWQERGHGWFALGFRHIPDARHASFKPGSPDLPAVAASIDRIGAATLPHVVRDWPENRYDRYADDGTAAMFAGSALLHGDINPDNFLIGPDNEITIVDWSWPTHGAGFIDPACLVVQLIAAGHSPAEAEAWATRCAAWRNADPAAVDAFARAMTRMYQRFEQLDPEPWRRAMTASAMDWVEYRGQHPARGPKCFPDECLPDWKPCSPDLTE